MVQNGSLPSQTQGPLRVPPLTLLGWTPYLEADVSFSRMFSEEPGFPLPSQAPPSRGARLAGGGGGGWLFIGVQLSFKSLGASNIQSLVPATH